MKPILQIYILSGCSGLRVSGTYTAYMWLHAFERRQFPVDRAWFEGTRNEQDIPPNHHNAISMLNNIWSSLPPPAIQLSAVNYSKLQYTTILRRVNSSTLWLKDLGRANGYNVTRMFKWASLWKCNGKLVVGGGIEWEDCFQTIKYQFVKVDPRLMLLDYSSACLGEHQKGD